MHRTDAHNFQGQSPQNDAHDKLLLKISCVDVGWTVEKDVLTEGTTSNRRLHEVNIYCYTSERTGL